MCRWLRIHQAQHAAPLLLFNTAAATSVSAASSTSLTGDSIRGMPASLSVSPYDAMVLVSFGGPEKPDDVLPFLRNVTAGRNVPDERLEEVARHYFDFGGRSPINEQCRALLASLRRDLADNGISLPVYWGNRNWDPYLAHTTAQMRRDGVQRAAAFVTSAYSSYSGCRQYRENLHDAVAAAPLQIDRLRHYFNHPGFVESFVDSTCAALATLPSDARRRARLLFVTHSIPVHMAASSGPGGGAYVTQHRSVAGLVAAGVHGRTGVTHGWDLVYCSRSGDPRTPWLEPDINARLATLAAHDRSGAVVVVPIGFVSDHMEVVYDLDTEAAVTAKELKLPFARAATPGVHPAFVAMVRDLLLERAAVERGETIERAASGELGPCWDLCPPNCCPNPRGHRPALGEQSDLQASSDLDHHLT